ncbi:ubiquitin 3 binding protein But2 C-terminal domain-containing protein [Xylaria castorea]|nr:ubiquitin 3 binding protein But2 C-terminal domain-containing protein [Xylaria castorea]
MRQSGCSFHMRTEGALLGAPVSQYDSGQTRAGPNETPSSFTLNGNTLTDAKGRGCWWTPPAMVLQCDVGQTPEPGFSIGCDDGTVSHNGQTTFYECETGADNLTMIYLGPNGSRCSEITLHADGCYPSGCSGQGTGSGSGSGSASPAASSTGTLPLGGGLTTYPVPPSYPTGSGSGSGSGSTPPGNSPSGTSPGSGPGGASPGTSGTGTLPSGGSTTYPVPPSYPTGTIGTSPGSAGSTPPGQYPGGTPTGSTNGQSPTPGGGTPPGQYPGNTPTGGTSNGASPTPSGQSPGSTPIGSTPTGGSGSTPPGQYPGSTPSESTHPGGAGSTPSGQYPGGTPSGSTPNGASPTPSGNTSPSGSGSGTGSSTPPGQYPGGAPTTTGTGSSAGSTPTSPGGQTGTPGVSCPGELQPGAYEYPHLIIPVDSAAADSAAGTSLFGEVTSTISSAFNFDIPASDAGKTCHLVFYLPTRGQLETSSYTLSGGSGVAVEFGRLSGPVTEDTSYSNLPGVAESYGRRTLAPGNGYALASFACPAGRSVAFEMRAAEGDASTSLRYFQDYNPCPLGLYITVS